VQKERQQQLSLAGERSEARDQPDTQDIDVRLADRGLIAHVRVALPFGANTRIWPRCQNRPLSLFLALTLLGLGWTRGRNRQSQESA
jgi:hypothetical protein